MPERDDDFVVDRGAPTAEARYAEELEYINRVLSWRGARKCMANYIRVSSSQITAYLSGDVMPGADKFLLMHEFLKLPRARQIEYLNTNTNT